MAKRGPGRPRAINVNPTAVTDLAEARGFRSQADLATAAKLSPQFLSDMLRGKGAALGAVERLSSTLGCRAATIAPTLAEGPRFFVVRDGDELPKEAA